MCGIAGLVHVDGGPIDHEQLGRMAAALAHRGPDGQSLHIEPGIGLAHRRLSVIDLDGGAQPMCNEDGSVVLVFNGEIYNFEVLKATLAARGHIFATRSDTETIIHGWEEWGEAVVEHLEGMFAFAVWDRRRRTLFLARDRLGKKPLHLARLPDGLAFASELAAFKQLPGVDRRVDPAALEDYLALGYVPDPSTIFAGITKLPPAHTLTLRTAAPHLGPLLPVRYWRPAPTDGSASDLDQAADQLRSKLGRATAERLVADVPLGAFLSGGLDSGAVVAAAAAARGSSAPLSTFTIGFPGGQDESGPAAAMAAHVGASHTVERADGIDWIDAASHQGRMFGEPFGDSSAVPTAQVCALARRHVTVALSGDGGDEVFAGYRRHRWHMLVEAARRHLPTRLREGPLSTLARLYPKLDRAPRFLRAKHTLTELSLSSALGYYRTMARTDDARRRALLHPSIISALHGYDPAARFIRLMEDADGDPLAQAQHVDLATWLPGQMLTKVDRTSMASGLEVRSPLLDHHLVEWGLALPAAYKLRHGRGKTILRAAAAPWLPPEILDRPKQGFAMPLGAILRAEMAPVRARLSDPDFIDANLVRSDSIRRLLDEHDSGRFDHAQPIWLLLVLQGFVASELSS